MLTAAFPLRRTPSCSTPFQSGWPLRHGQPRPGEPCRPVFSDSHCPGPAEAPKQRCESGTSGDGDPLKAVPLTVAQLVGKRVDCGIPVTTSRVRLHVQLLSRVVGHCATGSPVRENPVVPCSVIRIVRVRLRLRNKGANRELRGMGNPLKAVPLTVAQLVGEGVDCGIPVTTSRVRLHVQLLSRVVGHCATGSPVRENPVVPCSVIRIVPGAGGTPKQRCESGTSGDGEPFESGSPGGCPVSRRRC